MLLLTSSQAPKIVFIFQLPLFLSENTNSKQEQSTVLMWVSKGSEDLEIGHKFAAYFVEFTDSAQEEDRAEINTRLRLKKTSTLWRSARFG